MTRGTPRERPKLWIGLGVVLAVLGLVSCVRMLVSSQPVLGVEWIQASVGPVAVAVDPEGPAGRAGLEAGDVLQSVDGEPVEAALDAGELAWSASAGSSLRLEILRGAERRVIEVAPALAGGPQPYGFLCLVGFAFLVSGITVASRFASVRGAGAYVALAYGFHVLLVFTYTGSAGVWDWIFHAMDLVAGALVPAMLLHFCWVVAKRRGYGLVAVPYAVSGAMLLAAAWAHPAVFGGAYAFPSPAEAMEFVDRALVLFLGIAIPVGSIWLLRGLLRARSESKRGPLRWMFWGVAGGLLPLALLYALPWGLGAAELPEWAQFLSVVPALAVPALCTAALARYRLYDLDLFARRMASETVALFATLAVYAAAVYVLYNGVGAFFGLSRSGSRYLGILLAVLAYPQARRWTKTALERAFFRKRYSFRATLLDWARDLNAELDLGTVVEGIRDRVRETLGVSRAEVYLVDADRVPRDVLDGRPAGGPLPAAWTESAGNGVSARVTGEIPGLPWIRYGFPMRVKGEVRAFLAVSGPPTGASLTSEDRALLATVAAHAATALEAARLIHEVQRNTLELEAVLARERTVLESSAVGLALLDAEGRVVAWNQALEKMYGLERADALGRSLSDIFPISFARALGRELAEMTEDGDHRTLRHSLTDLRARKRILNLALSRVRGGAGACVVAFDDVTDRVRMEEQMLRQERLASLGLLAAGVAHEVNTPLTGISSYAQMLLEDMDPADPRRRILEKIEAQTSRASGIANSLLNLARPEGTAAARVGLNDLVREAAELMAPQVRRSGVRLELDLDDRGPAVRGDRGKLQQVLLNLILNARDAVDGDGTIRVRTSLRGKRAAIEVSDDGKGIPAEDLPRVFDPFFSTKGPGRGTGLGLSISHGIVQEHGGTIEVESEPGDTRFRVDLPATAAAEAMG